MKILLDTHFLLWTLSDDPPPAFSARAVKLIENAEQVFFSSASIWEIGLKWKRGKIARAPRKIAQLAVENGLTELPVSMEAMLVSCELQQEHSDPFDRLLYAQAKLGKLRLLTVDSVLQGVGAVVLVPT